MIRISNLLKEGQERYGCVMIYYDFPQLENIQKEIEPEDVYTKPYDHSYGLEDEPHCTLLYGLHDEVTDKEVVEALSKFTFRLAEVDNISVFENGEYDVLKFNIKSENLHEANKVLKEFPHTTSFPDYNPHLTVAYLKEGTGKKYVEKFKNQSYEIQPEKCVFSKADKTKSIIKIKIQEI